MCLAATWGKKSVIFGKRGKATETIPPEKADSTEKPPNLRAKDMVVGWMIGVFFFLSWSEHVSGHVVGKSIRSNSLQQRQIAELATELVRYAAIVSSEFGHLQSVYFCVDGQSMAD